MNRQAPTAQKGKRSVSSYTGWNQPLRVTLTRTSNPYLAHRLPMVGLLKVLEMRTDNFAMTRSVSFLEIDADGNPVGTRVMVDDAEFSYSLPEDWKARQRGQQQ